MRNLASSSTRISGGALTDGMRLGAGPGAATFVLGLAYGAAASAAGWGGAVPLVFSMLACSGSAQFTLLTTLPAGSAVAAAAAAVLINARYLVMSVALNDSLRGGRLRRALQALGKDAKVYQPDLAEAEQLVEGKKRAAQP